MKNLLLILALSIAATINAQQKEVLIIGTMHTVPSIVGHSYKPLLKKAIAYHPEEILTEDIMPTDSLSLNNFTPSFVKKAEESLQSAPISTEKAETLLDKEVAEMSQEEFAYLAEYFLQQKDRANYAYYSYLAEYGCKGSKKPLRNESDDVTHQLAIAMGIRQLLPIDSHHNDEEYNRTKYKAIVSGADNGDLKRYNTLQKKINRKQAYYALTGRLGRFTNKQSTLEKYYQINSIRYVEHPNEETQKAMELWDERNKKMAQHIVMQMKKSNASRFVLIVGAGHVISLENAVKNIDSNIEVKKLE